MNVQSLLRFPMKSHLIVSGSWRVVLQKSASRNTGSHWAECDINQAWHRLADVFFFVGPHSLRPKKPSQISSCQKARANHTLNCSSRGLCKWKLQRLPEGNIRVETGALKLKCFGNHFTAPSGAGGKDNNPSFLGGLDVHKRVCGWGSCASGSLQWLSCTF